MNENRPILETLDDAALLERYVRERSDEAFSALTKRYGPLVHGVAGRILGRADLAEDAAQSVWVLLARRAGRLRGRESLGGWLHLAARRTALDLRRRERRRIESERRGTPPPARGNPDPNPDPDLDAAIARLRAADRELVLRRFVRGESLAELGAALGIGEDAARMRVNRALATLRRGLGHAGAALPIETLLRPEASAPFPKFVPEIAPRRFPFVPAYGAALALVVALGIGWRAETGTDDLGALLKTPWSGGPGLATVTLVAPGPASTWGLRLKPGTVPLRLVPKAIGRQVFGWSVFAVPFRSGTATVYAAGRPYRVRVVGTGEARRLLVDRDGDGRFAPSERLVLSTSAMKSDDGRPIVSEWRRTTLLPIGGPPLPIGFRLVPDDGPTIARWAGRLVVAPEYAYVGTARIGGSPVRIGVTGVGSPEDVLTIDRNGDGRPGEGPNEHLPLGLPFPAEGGRLRAHLDTAAPSLKIVRAP